MATMSPMISMPETLFLVIVGLAVLVGFGVGWAMGHRRKHPHDGSH